MLVYSRIEGEGSNQYVHMYTGEVSSWIMICLSLLAAQEALAIIVALSPSTLREGEALIVYTRKGGGGSES